MFAVEWETARRRRTASDQPRTRPISVPLPAALATAPRQRLVGREAEWRDARRGVGAQPRPARCEVVLIGGEAGAGKTRSRRRVRPPLPRRGSDRCCSARATPSWPCRISRGCTPSTICCAPCPASVGRSISDRDLGDLLVLLPQLERLLPGLPRPAAADPETERYLLFSAVDRVLASAARQAPVLVLLDDVHWAGRQTLELLRHLVRAGSAAS